MKLATTGLVLAMVLSPSAMAQVTDLTGNLHGQTQSTLSTNTGQTAQGILDQRTGIDSRLRQQTDIDTRLDTDLDSTVDVDDTNRADADAHARISQSLQSSLSAYDRNRAGSRLATQLEQRSQTHARVSATVTAPDRPTVNTGGTGRVYASDEPRGDTYVVVYSRDGYRIGSVTRYDGQSGGTLYFDRSGIDADGIVSVPQADAMFDMDAQAVILDATRADITGMASVG